MDKSDNRTVPDPGVQNRDDDRPVKPQDVRSRRSANVPIWVLAAVMALTLVLLLGPSRPQLPDGWANTLDTTVASIDRFGDAPALDRFAEIAEVATDAVVRIESRSPVAMPGEGQLPEMLRPFFGPESEMPEPMPSVSGGSGVIVTPDGRILTNAHVVRGENLTVWLDDRRSFKAEVVGVDPTTDIAVLEIDANGLPTLPLGDSDDLRVGDWVLAIGSPGVGGGQLDQTVTSGIVSALSRPLQLVRRGLQEDPRTRDFAGYAIENFIQTDAVINPGNSGGPLLDMEGRVVGINTAIASTTGYYLGYGFAVPANLASGVLDDLVEYGEVRRAQLGVTVTTVTPEDMDFFDLDEVRGVLVQGTTPDGPADRAGVRQGDVILAVDGSTVGGVGDLQQEVAERSPGDEVELTVVRDGAERAVIVALGRVSLPSADARSPADEPEAVEKFGLVLGTLTEARRAELGYSPRAEGALVLEVAPLSPATRRGIPTGALVTEVGREPIVSPAEVVEALEGVEPSSVTALVIALPDGSERIVTVRMPQ